MSAAVHPPHGVARRAHEQDSPCMPYRSLATLATPTLAPHRGRPTGTVVAIVTPGGRAETPTQRG